MIADAAHQKPCAGSNTIAALLAGRIDADLEQHLDACDACRRLVADLGRGLSAVAGPTAAVTASLPQVGDRLDRYTIERVIGVGGMGVVYEARDRALARTVAIKLLRPDIVHTDQLLAEAQAMARLQHANVIAVHDVGRFHGQLYVCMEYVAGTTLRGWLAAERRTWRDIVAAFAAAGRGLAYVHAAGLVHLDVKPDNILVGRDGRIAISDFGLASAHGYRGVAVGTPAYMAPEQRRGTAIGPRTDQFSFCAALREALGTRGPRRLHAAIARGLADRPADRFASMDALLAALAPRRSRLAIAAGVVAVACAIALAVPHPVETVTRFVDRPVLRSAIVRLPGASVRDPDESIDGVAELDDPAHAATAQLARATRASETAAVPLAPELATDVSQMTVARPAIVATRARSLPIDPGSAPPPAATCDDGGALACTTREPSCPPTTVLAVQGGCWTCADARSCASVGVPHACDDRSRLTCTAEPPACSGRDVPSLHGGCWRCANPFTCPQLPASAGRIQPHEQACGNAVCERGEDPTSCPGDCHAPSGSGAGAGSSSGSGTGSQAGSGSGDDSPTCGNGFCEAAEDHTSCPSDCCEPDSSGACKAVCGNAFCEAGEDHVSCPADCCEPNADGSCAAS